MESQAPKVAAIVVTYNRRDLLSECIGRILGQDGAVCDVLVIDNASTDGTAEMVWEEFPSPRMSYFNTGYNLGGAGGFMCGIEAAVMLGYDYVWIMDDDCLPDADALKELLDADGRLGGKWGFLSSAVYWTDGGLCQANRVKKDLFRHVNDVGEATRLVPIVMGSFVSMLVKASVVQKVGLPIGEYFIWSDDYEFSRRISRRHPCYYVPASKVTHAMKVNTRADLTTADASRMDRFRHLYRNDVHCYRQDGLIGHAYLAAKAAYTAADVILHAKEGKAERIKTLAEGYRSGFRFNPSVVYPGKGKKKVLIYTDGWGCGGIESFVMNVLRNIDLGLFDVSIFSPWDAGDDWLGDELRELGVKRFTLQSGERPSNLKRGIFDLRPFIRMFDLYNIDVFHANTTTVVGLAYCKAAKTHGVKKTIAHSHNSSFGSGSEALKNVLHTAGQNGFNRFVDVKLACSTDAGRYLFGNLPFEVIRNGIETERFRFDLIARESVRKSYGIDPDCFLVGNIGRLADEKDPLFQLRVFAELQKLDSNARYLMVGQGPLEHEVNELISDLDLCDSVIRVPTIKNPEQYYSALDAFLFPSTFEGLPISVVEAQCAGLPVLASSHLTQEMDAAELVHWKGKEETPASWAKSLMSIRELSVDRISCADKIVKSGFSIAETSRRIAEHYSE